MRKVSPVWLAGLLAVLGPWSATVAFAQESEDEQPPVAPAEAAAHHTRGEVLYGEQWMPVGELFQQYEATQAEMEQILQQGREKRIELDDLNRKINLLRNDTESKERPLRTEMAKAVADKRKAEWALRAKPPAEPRYQPSPPRPSRSSYSTEEEYKAAIDIWRGDCKQISEENKRLREEYQRVLSEYETAKTEAQGVIDASSATVAERQLQLDKLAEELKTAQMPFLEQLQDVNDEIQSMGRQARMLLTRTADMEEAMRATPQELPWKNGIVEWEGRFRRLDDLRALHAELQAEIDRMRMELEQAAQLAGRDFPDDWRHPEQNRIDAMKALVEQAEKASASP